MAEIKLRDYQEEAVKKVLQHVKSGERKLLAIMSTGMGKTTFFSYLAGVVKQASGKKSLIIAHRDELLTQAKDRVELMNPGMVVGIEQGNQHVDGTEDVIVASVQSIGRAGSTRIQKFNPKEFGLVIIDETHHVTSSSYQNVLQHFNIVKDTTDHPVLLGVTATPNRADGEDLSKVFDHVVCNYDIKYGIQNGYLSSIKAYTVNTDTDISEVGVTAGDFKVGELGQAVNTDSRNELIIATYKKLLKGKKAIAFCVNVEHSKELAEQFVKAKIKAASVTGDTPSEERERIMEQYKNGDIQVLCNVLVATEGFDAPETEGVLLARPTKSEGLYIQMAGRGLRIADKKDHVKLIDFVDNMKNNSIVSSSCFIGLQKPIKADGTDIFEYEDKFKQIVATNPFADISSIDLDKLDEHIKEVNIFQILNTPDDIRKVSKNSWTPYGTGYKISLGKQTRTITMPGMPYGKEIEVATVVVIQENAIGKYAIDIIELTAQEPSFRNGFSRWKKKVVHTEEAPMKDIALMRADKTISEKYPSSGNLIRQDAKWKKQAPTEGQVKYLKKFGVSDDDLKKMDKGQAGNLLSFYFAQKEKQTGKKRGWTKNL